MREGLIELDGAVGEGGGQILRTALALAMCTGRAIAIRHIRAKRPKPGLMRQHLACVQAAAAVCGARTAGAELGSQALEFVPGAVRPGEYSFAVGSAGSCTLVLQTVLPALITASATSRVTLTGGTHNPMAPPAHFLMHAFLPLVRKLGAEATLDLKRHGFYPAGGGELEAQIRPGALVPFDLIERGALREQFAECLAAGTPANVAARELAMLGSAFGWARERLRAPALRRDEGPGNALMATLEHEHVTEVFTSFGERGVSAEEVARRLVAELRAYKTSTAALGPYLADQWMLPLALAVAARRESAAYTCTSITQHTRTNIETIERFLPVRFAIESERIKISPLA